MALFDRRKYPRLHPFSGVDRFKNGDGTILVNNSQALGLPPEQHLYDLSLWHQLHCLIHIREMMAQAKSAGTHTNAPKSDETLQPKDVHLWHCFDFIRQALMCAGDLALEPQWENDDLAMSSAHISPWQGVPHKCKSWVCQQVKLLKLLLTLWAGRRHGLHDA